MLFIVAIEMRHLQSRPRHRTRQRTGNLGDGRYLDFHLARPFRLLARIPCASGRGKSGERSLIALSPVRVVEIPQIGGVAGSTPLRAVVTRRGLMSAGVAARSRSGGELGRMSMLLLVFRRSRRGNGARRLRKRFGVH